MFSTGANGAVPEGASDALTFQKRCSIDLHTSSILAQTRVADFDSCIDMCASYNFWHATDDCTGATYSHEGICWIKFGSNTLIENDKTDSAVVVQ